LPREAEKAHLEVLPVEAPLPAIHPNFARLYREKVARLEEELADPEQWSSRAYREGSSF